MKRSRCYAQVLLFILLLCLLTGCAPTPDNTQIEAAIRVSLAEEEYPPDLDFAQMQVPILYSGKAGVVLSSVDGRIRRNYFVQYDRAAKTFLVTECSASVLDASADSAFRPPAPLNSYAERFDFTDNVNEQVMLVYVGEEDGKTDVRAQFEAERLAGFSEEELATFEELNLGGNTLVLLVPKYRGTVLAVTKAVIESHLHLTGEEAARFVSGTPIYLWCSWDGSYDIQISFQFIESVIYASEDILASCKRNNNVLIV